MTLVRFLIDWFILGMFVWIVLSYIVSFGRLGWDHPLRKVYDALSRVMDPILRPIRKVVPPVNIGGAALDLSAIILIFGLTFVRRLL